jgi:hypothetical protein
MIALLHAFWAQQPDSRSRLLWDPPIALPGQLPNLVSIRIASSVLSVPYYTL